MLGGAGADQLAEGLSLAALRQLLKIVDQQGIPLLRQRVKGEAGRSRVQAQHAPPRQQRVRQRAFSEAAGRAEKEDSALLDEAVKPLLDSRLYDGASGHVFPSPFETV